MCEKVKNKYFTIATLWHRSLETERPFILVNIYNEEMASTLTLILSATRGDCPEHAFYDCKQSIINKYDALGFVSLSMR